MSMLEKVAQAIAAENGYPWEGMSESRRRRFVEFSRAAIKAMRDPTPEVLEGVGEMHGFQTADWLSPATCHPSWWNSVIDKILEG